MYTNRVNQGVALGLLRWSSLFYKLSTLNVTLTTIPLCSQKLYPIAIARHTQETNNACDNSNYLT